jgi:toxin YhaV
MARGPVFAVRNGWRLRRSRAFAEVIDALEREVERLATADPDHYLSHPKAKLFVRITELILDEIPSDPNAAAYALGNTLGPAHRHWRRAKFLQRFRLFFRFDSASRTIIYSWVNDENTLRKAGSRRDPYLVFQQRLARGEPPDDWVDLLQDSEAL